VIGVVTELVVDDWAFVFGAVTTDCVTAEGMGAEPLPRSDLEVEAVGEVVTAECAGTEAVACNGLTAGGAGNTVIGEGLGMVTVACMGRGMAAGAGADAESGLLAE
jgi:hypothetical protein